MMLIKILFLLVLHFVVNQQIHQSSFELVLIFLIYLHILLLIEEKSNPLFKKFQMYDIHVRLHVLTQVCSLIIISFSP